MLTVPTLRQPNLTTCLPTCVAAVLAFLNHPADFEEIREWCYTTAVGSDADLAIQGLNEAGIDAGLVQLQTVAELAELIAEERPPIVILTQDDGGFHAVVVCDVTPETVVVMDPMVGGYVALSMETFEFHWLPLSGETLMVGKEPEAGAAAPASELSL